MPKIATVTVEKPRRPKQTAVAVSLRSLAAEINQSHEAAGRAAFSALKYAKQAGEGLIKAKYHVRHGQWLDWLEKNCPTLARTTTAGYMRVADRWAELESEAKANGQRVAHLNLRGALELLASSGEEKEKEPEGLGMFSVEEWEDLEYESQLHTIEVGFESEASLNPQPTDSIEWARFSLNTVTGCLHDCPYCYARDIATRLFKQKFVPTFHPDRLAAPSNTKIPAKARRDVSCRNIFANSMSDLFGQWVPNNWVEATISMAEQNPKWNFLTLTKFPQRAADFEFPSNWWMGTTIDAQCRVANAEKAFKKIKCGTKWLSVEPLLEPLTFRHLDLFQWIVIGGASPSTKTPAWPIEGSQFFEWVADLHVAARKAGLSIYYKTNCGMSDELRVREFPWEAPDVTVLPQAFRYLKGMK